MTVSDISLRNNREYFKNRSRSSLSLRLVTPYTSSPNEPKLASSLNQARSLIWRMISAWYRPIPFYLFALSLVLKIHVHDHTLKYAGLTDQKPVTDMISSRKYRNPAQTSVARIVSGLLLQRSGMACYFLSWLCLTAGISSVALYR